DDTGQARKLLHGPPSEQPNLRRIGRRRCRSAALDEDRHQSSRIVSDLGRGDSNQLLSQETRRGEHDQRQSYLAVEPRLSPRASPATFSEASRRTTAAIPSKAKRSSASFRSSAHAALRDSTIPTSRGPGRRPISMASSIARNSASADSTVERGRSRANAKMPSFKSARRSSGVHSFVKPSKTNDHGSTPITV